MSGICGAWAIGDVSAPCLSLMPMLRQLKRRGPDGTRQLQDGKVALGHTSLATTPEALVERMPLREKASGCTITADVRLDNRTELMKALDLSRETRTIGDGELILRAYLEWGVSCPEHLLGDFAFAIWDSQLQRLFCARDHIGMRQFNYHCAVGRLFVFATEAEAVVAHPSVPKRLDEGRIADALDNLEGIDFTSSFYEEVKRLPPAHSLTVDALGLKLARYWKLEPGPELSLDSDEAYAEAFLNVLTEAVRCRLRSAGMVGSMLSGGMDSGSVTAIASEILAAEGSGPLATFSAVGPNPMACIETRTVRAAVTLPGLAPHFIDHAELDEYREDLRRLWDGSHPFDAHMTLVRAVYLAAHRKGLKVMLDGGGGDIVLTAGNSIARMLRRGQIRQAWREAVGEERFWGPAWRAPKAFGIAAWMTFVPRPIRKLRREMAGHLRRFTNPNHDLVKPAFANRIGLKHRRKRFAKLTADRNLPEATRRAQVIGHPHLAAARERYDRVASALAIEPRDPFLDIRLVSFCLSLPTSQLQADGWPKILLRRALRGKLPEEVLWRRGKQHLGWAFTQSLFAGWDGWESAAQIDAENIAPYAKSARKGLRTSAVDIEARLGLFCLSRWLRRHVGCGSDNCRP